MPVRAGIRQSSHAVTDPRPWWPRCCPPGDGGGKHLRRVDLGNPGGTFELGAAGGPLIVGLVLGAIGRTGPLTWTLPYGMNSVLRQFGALLFFTTVGTRSGAAFADEVGCRPSPRCLPSPTGAPTATTG
jgi:hypothetical protein